MAGSEVKTKIQQMIDHAHDEHKREMLRRRIDLARQGVRHYEQRHIPEAVKAFHTYIRILEDWKGVPEGGLSPNLFDVKLDVPELVLISGVYWDLVKLYDRTKSKEREKEFRHYLQKYILFTKGLPYQALGAETMRKYISNEKPVHRDEFKNAYRVITNSKCFVASALVDVTAEPTIGRLRAFRDEVLLSAPAGRRFVAWYYVFGPKIADKITAWPRFVRRFIGVGLDFLALLLSAKWFRSG
jgi:P2-related tail formation protein